MGAGRRLLILDPGGSPGPAEPKKAGHILRGHPPFLPGVAENSWRQLCGGEEGGRRPGPSQKGVCGILSHTLKTGKT